LATKSGPDKRIKRTKKSQNTDIKSQSSLKRTRTDGRVNAKEVGAAGFHQRRTASGSKRPRSGG
jgi:hypothetical protein